MFILYGCHSFRKSRKPLRPRMPSSLKTWFGKLLTWILNSPQGQEEARQANNHSTAHDAQVIAFAMYAGNMKVAREVINAIPRKRLFTQIEPDGKQPHELRRTLAFGYSQFNLSHFIDIFMMARKIGISIDNATSEDGRSFYKAMDFLVPYVGKDVKAWPYQQISEWKYKEQNSYAGVTNKLLAQKACKICVAYDGMEKFFPADKIIMTGNPVRQNLLANKQSREAAVTSFGFNPEKKTILILGGSLGARTINQTLIAALDTIKAYGDIQFIWQTGKIYIQQVKDAITTTTGEAVRNPRISAIPNLYVTDFIKDMASAYAAADLVISRAGAGSISEFCLLNKPVILVPSPNVAEDHQTVYPVAQFTEIVAQ